MTKEKRIAIRVSEEDHERLVVAAMKAGKSTVSDYVRAVLLSEARSDERMMCMLANSLDLENAMGAITEQLEALSALKEVAQVVKSTQEQVAILRTDVARLQAKIDKPLLKRLI